MNSRFRFPGGRNVALAGLLLAGVGLAAAIGAGIGVRFAQPAQQAPQVSPLELMAGTAARTNSLSMATGLVDGNVEGLWILDHMTGTLQCWVLNPRNPNNGAIYQANVAADLGAGKAGDGEYLMTTGNFFFDGGNLGNNVPGQSICYVADAKTGNVVGYGVVYNKQIVSRGMNQGGPLRVVCQGKARLDSVNRDQ